MVINYLFLKDTNTFVNTERFIHKLKRNLDNTFSHIN